MAVPDMSLRNTSASIVRFLEARFAELGSEGNTITVTIDSNAPWWIADRQHPYSKAAEQAVLQECGVSTALMADMEAVLTEVLIGPTVVDQGRRLSAIFTLLGESLLRLRRSFAHGISRRSCTFG